MGKQLEKNLDNYEAPDMEIPDSDLDKVNSAGFGTVATVISPGVNTSIVSNPNISTSVVAMPNVNTSVATNVNVASVIAPSSDLAGGAQPQ